MILPSFKKILITAPLVFCATLFTASVLAATDNQSIETPIVKTGEGRLQGHVSKGVYEFLGVHYGASTEGGARFLPPNKPDKWKGVRKADAKGDRCPQPDVNMPGEMATVLSFSDLPTSEDCLVLDLWTPGVGDEKARPVMVWLHGGGYFVGSGGDKYYHGSNLARGNDVIVVSLNHRLNAFGFFDLGDKAGSKYQASGNVGMLDIVRALEWVQENITKFGGDPNNVTVFGQSGGAGKVSNLLAMPQAKGLFHKAILQSGANPIIRGKAESAEVSKKLYEILGVEPGDVKALQAMPADVIVKAAAKMGLLPFGPHIDGKVITQSPFDPAPSTYQGDVPIMLGYTKDEATNVFLTDPSWDKMTDADLTVRANMVVPPHKVKEVIALYRKKAPKDKPMHLWSSMVTDQMFASNTIVVAERKAAEGNAPVYMYKIDWETPVLGGKLRSPHAVELPLVFDTVYTAEGLVGNGERAENMAKAMSQSFAAFARSGNPNTLGLPEWKPYTLQHREVLVFDDQIKVISNPNSEVREFWQNIQKEKASGTAAITDAFNAKKFD
jgi:para-nitrobenzyl esterase